LDYGNPNSVDVYGAAPQQSQYGAAPGYVSYADKTDYVLPTQEQTISEISKDYGTLVVEEKKSFVLNTKEIAVENGETAYSIAKKYNMPLQRLAVLNNLAEPYQLKVGQKLKIESAEIVTTKTEITKTEMGSTPIVRTDKPVITSNASVKLPTLSARAGAKFAWPVRGNIISDFGPKKSGLTNDGINISASVGTTVGAADNGIVAYAGNELKGLGNLLIIQHAGGWMTVYAHLDEFVVRRGDKVSIGQKIGTVGQTGKVSEPQLHFEIRKGSKAYDPKKELK
jgi:murein DD-endopeptidase MepM/ murein hydrolase activator NlpD